MNNLRIFSIIVLCLVPHSSRSMSSPSQQNRATLFGLFGTAIGAFGSYYAYQYYKKQKKADALIQKIHTKLPTGVPTKIGEYLVQRNIVQTYEERIKLIPAVISVRKNIIDDVIITTLEENKVRCEMLRSAEEYQTLKYALEELNRKLNREKAIALYASIISPNEVNSVRFIDLAQQQRDDCSVLFCKNEIRPNILLGRVLLPGEMAIVGYSDGDMQIILENNDRKVLNNLSEKEREVLHSLYKSPTRQAAVTMTLLNRPEWNTLEDVFTDINKHNCIRDHYGLQINGGHQPWHWKKTLMFSTVGFLAYAMSPCVIFGNRKPLWKFSVFRKFI